MTAAEVRRIKAEITRLEKLMLNIFDTRKTDYTKKNAARLDKLRRMIKDVK